MAEIDKGLPNTRTELDVPSEEEIARRSCCSRRKTKRTDRSYTRRRWWCNIRL